jgi:hypothetical protein
MELVWGAYPALRPVSASVSCSAAVYNIHIYNAPSPSPGGVSPPQRGPATAPSDGATGQPARPARHCECTASVLVMPSRPRAPGRVPIRTPVVSRLALARARARAGPSGAHIAAAAERHLHRALPHVDQPFHPPPPRSRGSQGEVPERGVRCALPPRSAGSTPGRPAPLQRAQAFLLRPPFGAARRGSPGRGPCDRCVPAKLPAGRRSDSTLPPQVPLAIHTRRSPGPLCSSQQ